MSPGNNLTGVAVQFATHDQMNASKVQKYIAIYTCAYVEHFIQISSKLEFFATQNFESKLFPAWVFN